MRNFLTTSFIALALLVGATSMAPIVYAAGAANGASCNADADCSSANCVTYVCIAAGATSASMAVPPGVTSDNAKISGDVGKSDGDKFGVVMTWIMSLFAWLVGVAAMTLDYAVYYTVVTMGAYVKNLTAVGVTWRILRDIGNIMLIFGFIAIGVSIILNTERIGYGKKMLPMLLVGAIFLNFSLFMTEAVIDVSNIFATQFYTQINGGTAPSTASLSAMTTKNEGISNKIMNQLGLQTIYGGGTANTKIFEGGNSWTIGFMGILLFLITAFVMFSLAFILIARFVVLLFLIVVAPVGFVGLAIPQLKGVAGQWWSKLFEQVITAPVLLLLLYIALAVITDVNFLTGFGMTGGAAAAQSGWDGIVANANLPGFAGLLLSFLVAMGLLLAVIVFSKKLGAFGAAGATKLAGAATFGVTAWGMRSSAGWVSQRASERFKNTRLSRAPIIGRAISNTLDRGGKASFDIRGTKALKNFPGGGIDAGEAQKGGYVGWEKGAIKGREDYAKTLGQTGAEKKQQGVEEERKKMMEQTVKDIGKQSKVEVRELQEKHKAELESGTRTLQEAQKNFAKLESDQEKGATVSDEQITEARTAVTAAQTAQKQKVSEQRKEQESLESAHENMLEAQKKEVEARQGEVDKLKRAGQEGYAAGITWGPGQFFNRNTKAAENIRKEAKKGKSEKDLEKIKKFLEDSDKPKVEEKKPEAPAAH